MIEIIKISNDLMLVEDKQVMGDSYDGITNEIRKEGNKVGYLAFMEIGDYCAVDFIHVDKKERRKGIGTEVAKKLLETYTKIVAQSDNSKLSLSFFKSMNMTFDDKNKWWVCNDF